MLILTSLYTTPSCSDTLCLGFCSCFHILSKHFVFRRNKDKLHKSHNDEGDHEVKDPEGGDGDGKLLVKAEGRAECLCVPKVFGPLTDQITLEGVPGSVGEKQHHHAEANEEVPRIDTLAGILCG